MERNLKYVYGVLTVGHNCFEERRMKIIIVVTVIVAIVKEILCISI